MLPGRAWAHSIEKTCAECPLCGRKSLASAHFEIWVLEVEKISEISKFQTGARKIHFARDLLHIGSRLLYQTKEDTLGYNFLWYHFFLRRTPSELGALELGRMFQVDLPAGNF